MSRTASRPPRSTGASGSRASASSSAVAMVDEAAHVASVARLVGGRDAQELVDVGQPPRAARQREHVQVVARCAARRAGAPRRAPGAARARARRRTTRGRRARRRASSGARAQGVVVDGLPQRRGALARAERQQRQRVGGQADHRRGQQPEQRLLVARVGQRGEQVAQVADLLAPPPSASAGRQRRQARPAPARARRGPSRPTRAAARRRRAARRPRRARARPTRWATSARLGLLDRAGGRQPEAQRAGRVAVPGVGVGDQQLDHAARAPAASSRPGRRSTQWSCSEPKAPLSARRISGRERKLVASVAVAARRLQARRGARGRPRRRRGGRRRSPAARRRPCRRCRARPARAARAAAGSCPGTRRP